MKLLMLTLDGACCTPVFVSFLAERCADRRSRRARIFAIGVVVGGCRFLAIFNLLRVATRSRVKLFENFRKLSKFQKYLRHSLLI